MVHINFLLCLSVVLWKQICLTDVFQWVSIGLLVKEPQTEIDFHLHSYKCRWALSACGMNFLHKTASSLVKKKKKQSSAISSSLPCRDTHPCVCEHTDTHTHTMHVNTDTHRYKWSHTFSFVMLNTIRLKSEYWLAHFSGFGGFNGWREKGRLGKRRRKTKRKEGLSGGPEWRTRNVGV